MEHRGRDFTIQVVAGEIEFLEPPKLANLCRDCLSYVVVRQHTVEQMDTITVNLTVTVRKGKRNTTGHKGYHLPYA